jgi:hypothetical protein
LPWSLPAVLAQRAVRQARNVDGRAAVIRLEVSDIEQIHSNLVAQYFFAPGRPGCCRCQTRRSLHAERDDEGTHPVCRFLGRRRWRSGLISFYVATLAPFWFSNMVVSLVVSWIATIFAMDGSLKNAAGAKEQVEAERSKAARSDRWHTGPCN